MVVNTAARIAFKMVNDLNLFQVIYMVVFGVYGVWANMYHGPYEEILGINYLLLSVGSLIIVLPVFRRALFHKNDPLHEHRLIGKPLARYGMRLYVYVVLPVFFVALLQVISAITSAGLHFDQSNVQPAPHLKDYFVPILAGMEEVWRWSMIGTVLICGKILAQSRWTKSARIRSAWFVLAVLASSVGFGSGHILEFHSNRLVALALFSTLGVFLALFSILTGRILLVMCVHMAYDLWVTILASIHGSQQLFGAIIYAALLLAPVCTVLWHKSLRRLRAPLDDEVHMVSRREDVVRVFDLESNRIRKVFRKRHLCFIDHIGSTAVNDLAGDDSIDIQVAVHKLKLSRKERREMEDLGYEVFGRAGVRDRIFLRKKDHPNIHVHVVVIMGPFAHASLKLRAYFQMDEEVRETWLTDKEQLLDSGNRTLRNYIDAKHDALLHIVDALYESKVSSDDGTVHGSNQVY